MNAIDIDKKLETFGKLIQEFGAGSFPAKEVWQRQKEIAENFKAAQFETAEAKDIANEKFDVLIQQMKEKELEAEAANEKFSEEAELLIAQMDAIVAKQTEETPLDKNDFQELRKLGNQAFEYFKVPRWPSKERRTIAWEKYASLRNIIKDKEDGIYTKEREERSKLISQSLEITEKLCVVVDACHPKTEASELLALVNRFHQFLQDAGLSGHAAWYLIDKPEDIKYSLKVRTATINDVRNFVNYYKDHLTREHKGEIFASIDALKEDLNKAWETHKEEQQKRQEEWEIKKKERDEKRIEWIKNQQNFLIMLEKRYENQIAYKDKQEKYLQGQKEYAERFENRVKQQHEYIGKLNDQLVDLEKKHATAWTDSFREKVEEWMKEKNDKIEAVVKDIEVLKEKITDINKNIDELPAKIQELTTSIEEIKSKIEEVKEKLSNDSFVPENVVSEVVENKDINENNVMETVVGDEDESS